METEIKPESSDSLKGAFVKRCIRGGFVLRLGRVVVRYVKQNIRATFVIHQLSAGEADVQ